MVVRSKMEKTPDHDRCKVKHIHPLLQALQVLLGSLGQNITLDREIFSNLYEIISVFLNLGHLLRYSYLGLSDSQIARLFSVYSAKQKVQVYLNFGTGIFN